MKNSNRFTWAVFTLTCLSGLLVTGLSDSAPRATADEPPSTAPANPPLVEALEKPKTSQINLKGKVIADESALNDIQKIKKELNEKQKELDAREAELTAREAALKEEMTRFDEIKASIAGSRGINAQEAEEKLSKLVEALETMSPKAIAPLVSNLDETLATQALSRVSSTKLGKILAALDPNRSARLSERLAGVVRAKGKTTSRDVAEATQ